MRDYLTGRETINSNQRRPGKCALAEHKFQVQKCFVAIGKLEGTGRAVMPRWERPFDDQTPHLGTKSNRQAVYNICGNTWLGLGCLLVADILNVLGVVPKSCRDAEQRDIKLGQELGSLSKLKQLVLYQNQRTGERRVTLPTVLNSKIYVFAFYIVCPANAWAGFIRS